MSVFDTPNAEGYPGLAEEASAGPHLGFQDALMASWDVQTKVNSLFAIEKAFGDAERAQIDKMRAAGLRPHKPLADVDEENSVVNVPGVNHYMAAARALVDEGGPGETEGPVFKIMADRDAHIMRERDAHPELGLKTYGEMFTDIQTEAREAKRRDDQSKTIMGHVGSLLGGAAGGLNPTTDPLNVATLPLGAGKTIAARIAAQVGAQGAAEGFNVLMSPDTNRLLLGQDLTPGEIAMRIGGAAVGGALVQGVGEAAVIAGRRVFTGKWFHDAPLPDPIKPKEPAPPAMGDVPRTLPKDTPLHEFPTWESFRDTHADIYNVERVYGTSREASLREAEDVLYIAQQLDRWDGPRPGEIPARTAAALPPEIEPGVRYDKPYSNYVDRMESVDDVARRLDPDLFRTYDLYAQHRTEGRDKVAELQTMPPSVDRDRAIEIARGIVVRADERMRDMAPLVSRVYGSAEKEWRSTPVDFSTLAYLKRLEEGTGWRYRGDGRPSLTERPLRVDPPRVPASATVNDAVPLARLSPDLEAKIGPNSDATDRVRANVAHNIEAIDEKVTQFVGAARKANALDAAERKAAIEAAREKVAAAADPEAKVKAEKELDALEYVTFPDGSKLHLDNDHVVGAEGREMSVREFLGEMDKDQHALQSVTTCSRPS